jgi:hypothetical protein
MSESDAHAGIVFAAARRFAASAARGHLQFGANFLCAKTSPLFPSQGDIAARHFLDFASLWSSDRAGKLQEMLHVMGRAVVAWCRVTNDAAARAGRTRAFRPFRATARAVAATAPLGLDLGMPRHSAPLALMLGREFLPISEDFPCKRELRRSDATTARACADGAARARPARVNAGMQKRRAAMSP